MLKCRKGIESVKETEEEGIGDVSMCEMNGSKKREEGRTQRRCEVRVLWRRRRRRGECVKDWLSDAVKKEEEEING